MINYILGIGQAQLLRRQISHELQFSCHLDSNLLEHSLTNLNKANNSTTTNNTSKTSKTSAAVRHNLDMKSSVRRNSLKKRKPIVPTKPVKVTVIITTVQSRDVRFCFRIVTG